MSLSAKQWLKAIHRLKLPEKIRIMNVCGGHERAISKAGIRSLLPDNIELIPIRDPVRIVCEMLGFDPLYLACEGRVVAVVEESCAADALKRWQQIPQGAQASIIGAVTEQSYVVLQTSLGGQRILEELEDDPLPRIC